MKHFYLAPLWFELLCWLTALIFTYYIMKYAL